MRQSAVPGLAFSATTGDSGVGAAVVGAPVVDAPVAAALAAPVVGAPVAVGAGATGAAAPNGAAAAVVLVDGMGCTAALVPEVHADTTAATAAIAASRTRRPLPLYMAAAMLGAARHQGVDDGGAASGGPSRSTFSPLGTNSTHVGPGFRRIGWLLASTNDVTWER